MTPHKDSVAASVKPRVNWKDIGSYVPRVIFGNPAKGE